MKQVNCSITLISENEPGIYVDQRRLEANIWAGCSGVFLTFCASSSTMEYHKHISYMQISLILVYTVLFMIFY